MEEEYINFGDEQVSKQDLLKAIGDYKAYSSTQPWSAARRGAFDAVIELALNRGILGTRKYTNPDTGESMYYTTFGGDPFDINTYDKNTRRGWQDAASFIGRLAESLPTKKSIEEKKKKEEEERIAKLPTFDSNSFLSTLYKNISDKEFGGQAFDGKTFDMNRWNTLDDVRNEKTGAVGTDKRKEALAKYLEGIDRDFNAEEYNWKDSPFKDADDFKSRLGEAVRALRSPELDDDTPALNKLGINYKDWFNNRTGEVYTTDEQGNPITYGNYYRGLQAQKDAKIQAANAKAEAARKAYNANLIGGLKWYGKGLTGSPLSPENSNLDYLNQLAAKDSWNGDELSQLVGTFKLAQRNNALENLSKEELATFGPRFGSNPNRFKKIRELNGIYWDSLTNQIVKPYAKGQQNNGVNFQDILDQNNPDVLKNKQQQNYLNSTEGGFTPAEQREVAALLFDLGAAVDPEGFSSAGLSQIAAGIRDYNRASDPEGWTWGDTGWAALDHGLGLLSTIPIAGGWIKGGWAASKLAGYLPKIEKYIRLAGRAGSTYAMAANAPGALDTVEKIKKGEDLSLKDYQDLAYFFIGGLGHHQLNRGNRVERSAMKARGIETSNSLLNKSGITRTKAKTTSSTETAPTLKVQKTGEDGKVETIEIPIDKEKQKILSKTKAEDLEAKAKDLEIEIPEGYKIQSKSTSTKTWSRENLNRYRGKGNSEIFGTPTTTTRNSSALKSDEEFEQYLSEHNNTWLKKFFNGSNRDIRRYDKYLGNNSVKPTTEQQSETPKANETSGNNEKNSEISKQSKERIQKYNEYVKNREEKLSRGEFSKNKLKSGSANIDGHQLQIVEQSDGTFNLIYKGNIEGNYLKSQQKELQTKIRDIINNNRRNIKPNSPVKIGNTELGKILQDFKRKGWLKQGGRLDKQRIQQYKEFIKK